MSKRKLRAAVVGLRGIGRSHVKGILALNNSCELAAVCDINPEEAQKRSEEYGVPGFTSLGEMLKTQQIDFITVGTPHPFHAPVAIEAAKAGASCLVEKPIASTLSDAQKMVRAHKKSNTKLGVVFQRRFMPAFQQARKIIKKGMIGEIRRIVLEYTCCRTETYFQQAGWRGTWKGEGGGVLLNQAPHYLDLLVWLTDCMPKKVTAHWDHFLHDIEVEDRVDAYLTYANGASGHIHLSTCEAPGVERIEIHGDKGSMFLDNENIRLSKLEKPFLRFIQTSKKQFGSPKATWEEFKDFEKGSMGHAPVIEDFIKACRSKTRKPAISGEDASRSLELANAITLSGANKKAVGLPISAKAYDKLLSSLIKKSKRMR